MALKYRCVTKEELEKKKKKVLQRKRRSASEEKRKKRKKGTARSEEEGGIGLSAHSTQHSFIIIREVLILTLSIFIAL